MRYIDQRLTYEQFSNVKEKLPYGQFPVAKVEGEVLGQSMAITRWECCWLFLSSWGSCLRYFAAQYGLAGRTNLEMAQADEIVDAVNDMINKRIAARNETDERKKSTMTREVMSETIPATLVSL